MKLNECKRMLVTALGITEDGNIIKVSNGNEAECTGEIGNCGCTHAEINLLRVMPNPGVVIVSHSPCLDCAKALVEAEVKYVEYHLPYRLTEGIDYLVSKGVKVLSTEERLRQDDIR